MQQVELCPGLIVRPSVLLDAYALGPRLRPDDQAELDACSGSDPCEILAHGFLHGRVCLTLERDGRPIAMFGTVDHPDHCSGIIWLLGSPEIEDVARPFIRASRRFLQALAAPYNYVTNVLDERNLLHRRWLQWMGCTEVCRHENYGRRGEPFIEFVFSLPAPCVSPSPSPASL